MNCGFLSFLSWFCPWGQVRWVLCPSLSLKRNLPKSLCRQLYLNELLKSYKFPTAEEPSCKKNLQLQLCSSWVEKEW